jgi:hypothetical protein
VHKTELWNFLGKSVFVAILSHWTKLLPCMKVWILYKCRKIFIQFSWVCKQWPIKKKGITLHMSKVKIFINIVKIWNFLKFYLWRKVVCFVLFCEYEIHQTGMLQIVFLVSLESSRWGRVDGLGSMTFGLAVQKFWNIEYFFTEN